MKKNEEFDWKHPEYLPIYKARAARLKFLRANPKQIPILMKHYRNGHVDDFINDWGITYDPRNVNRGLPAKIPFLLFPKQRTWIQWACGLWRAEEDGLSDKSREIGVSWMAVSMVCSMAILHKGFTGGFGSRKLEYVDKSGDPKCLFWKAREFLDNLPVELRAGWERANDAHCRITFPLTGSAITGEAGEQIGRGDRTSIYVVDESAYVERQETVDAALSQTTRCRIDVSSANGMANVFARKRHSWPAHKIMTFHWRDDPRKDDAWYAEQVERLDSIVVAQELDINYMASVEGILIPAAWIHAAIDADKKLGFEVTGSNRCALDLADQGVDKNAVVVTHGVKVMKSEDWSGEASNLYRTMLRAFRRCDEENSSILVYDADGMGASGVGDAEMINESRERKIQTFPFHAVPIRYPEREDVPGLVNKDRYANGKAQAWWNLRMRFEKTFKAVMSKKEDGSAIWSDFDPDELIVIDGQMPDLTRFQQELVQVIYGHTMTGKLQIIKAEKGMKSPNMADALMMLFGTETEDKPKLIQTESMLERSRGVGFPLRCDGVFAVVCASMKPGRDLDGAAVVYCAHSIRKGYPSIVLDWDISEIDSRLLDFWLPMVYTNLDALARAAHARQGVVGVYYKDKTTGSVLLHRAEKIGGPNYEIETEIDDMDRALMASGLVKDGEVQIAEDAYQKIQVFKGIPQNHLIAQVSSYGPETKNVDSLVLLNAFTHCVSLAKGDMDGYG